MELLRQLIYRQDGTLGRFGTGAFLFSGGFFMSGYSAGNLWAFAQASASLIENMTPGTVASGPNDPDAVCMCWIEKTLHLDKAG